MFIASFLPTHWHALSPPTSPWEETRLREKRHHPRLEEWWEPSMWCATLTTTVDEVWEKGQQSCLQGPLYPAREADHLELEDLKRPSAPTCRQISAWTTQDQGQSPLFIRTLGRGLSKLFRSHTSLCKSRVAVMCGFPLGQRKECCSVGQGNWVW